MNFSDYDMVLIGIGEEFNENAKALDAYNKLAALLEKKNYFIVTLCLDDVIFESNLDKEKIVAPLGGKRKKQCPDACENKLYDVTETICPICKKELVYNNYLAENYIEDDYIPMWEKHKKWVSLTLNKKLLALELGVSFKLPQIIRWPFEKIVSLNNKAELIRVNETLPQLSEEVSGKGTSIKENSVEWVVGI